MPWKSLVFANLSVILWGNVGLHTNMTLIMYCIVSKKYTLNTYFLFSLKNIPFFLIFAVFDTLNTGRAALASPWKTILFPCFYSQAWYPPLNTSGPPGFTCFGRLVYFDWYKIFVAWTMPYKWKLAATSAEIPFFFFFF